MVIKEIIRVENLFLSKTKHNYHIFFEEILIRELTLKRNTVVKESRFIEKKIRVVKGENNSSVINMKEFAFDDGNYGTGVSAKLLMEECSEFLL